MSDQVQGLGPQLTSSDEAMREKATSLLAEVRMDKGSIPDACTGNFHSLVMCAVSYAYVEGSLGLSTSKVCGGLLSCICQASGRGGYDMLSM
jgi:hypothetical protein